MPLIEGIEAVPGSDALKHFGAAMASYGSVALFHMPGITAEDAVFAGATAAGASRIGRAEIDAFLATLCRAGRQGRCRRLRRAAIVAVRDGARSRRRSTAARCIRDTTLLVTTSPEIKHAADRMGLTERIEAAGAIVAAGICFYQSYAGEMAEANGWRRLMTNSAKLVNIIGGYGYRPTPGEPRTLRRGGGRGAGA